MGKSAIALARAKARRRHREHIKRSAVSDITAEQAAEMRRKARKCPMCGVRLADKPGLPNSKHLDHIIPICVGGTHTHGNVRIVCASCNLTRPKDGRDYAGPVTLWAQGEVVTGRARATCRKGLHQWTPENIKVVKGKKMCAPCEVTRRRKRAKAKRKRPDILCACGALFAAHGSARMCDACLDGIGRQAAAMHAGGMTWATIAKALGYDSYQGVRDLAAERAGYRPGRRSAEPKAKPRCQCGAAVWRNGKCEDCQHALAARAVRLRTEEGWTLQMIADELGYSSISSVANLIKTLVDVEPHMGRPSKPDRPDLGAIVRECWPSHTATAR